MTVRERNKVTIRGQVVHLPRGTSAETIALLRESKSFYSRRFIYTGNHVNGTDSDNGGAESFLKHCGVWDTDEDEIDRIYDDMTGEWYDGLTERAMDARQYNASLLYCLESQTDIYTLQTKEGLLTYHVHKHRSPPSNQFGYEVVCTYRMISLEKTS